MVSRCGKTPSVDITNNQEGILDSKGKTDVLLEEYKNEIKELTATEDDDIEEPKLRSRIRGLEEECCIFIRPYDFY